MENIIGKLKCVLFGHKWVVLNKIEKKYGTISTANCANCKKNQKFFNKKIQ